MAKVTISGMLPMPTFFMPGYESEGDTTAYSDWVEACVLFSGESVSKADVRDFFYEENTFRRGNTDEVVDNIWSELSRRSRILGKCSPFTPKGHRLEPAISWQECSGYAFCLLVSYAKSNKTWMNKCCCDYSEQGRLFELVTIDALRCVFGGWEVDDLGWSPERPALLRGRIEDICGKIGECIGSDLPRACDKDGAVDVLCYRSFADSRGNYPVFFVQCSTGHDWESKRSVSSLNLWQNWISFRAKQLPSRAFAVPFSFCEDAFVETQKRVDGLVLDRIRLFSMSEAESKWLTFETQNRLCGWITDKLETLDGMAE